MMIVPTYVAPSAIEGVGVFAAKPILKGTRVWELNPGLDRIVPREQIDTSPDYFKDYANRYGYPHHDDDQLIILELDNGRFMNHQSLDPNVEFSIPSRGIALRDIAEDEELTCDYTEFDPQFELMPARQFQLAKTGRSMQWLTRSVLRRLNTQRVR